MKMGDVYLDFNRMIREPIRKARKGLTIFRAYRMAPAKRVPLSIGRAKMPITRPHQAGLTKRVFISAGSPFQTF